MTTDTRFMITRKMRRLLNEGNIDQARKVITDSDLSESTKLLIRHELGKRSVHFRGPLEPQPTTKMFRIHAED